MFKAFRVTDGAPVAVKFIAHGHVREWTMFERQMIPTEICYLEECSNIPGVVKLVDWFARFRFKLIKICFLGICNHILILFFI